MTVRDTGESMALFEPLILSEGGRSRYRLSGLVMSLAEKSIALSSPLPPVIAASLADLGGALNCYYSNVVGNHDTHRIGVTPIPMH